jgi:hypothetical protein
MLNYTDDPVSNTGRLFAFICGSERNPIVWAVGATLFGSTMMAARRSLYGE